MTEPWLTDKQVHEQFDWAAYHKRLGMPVTKMLESLEVTYAGFYFWRRRNVCPAAVWKRCVRLWGNKGLKVLAPIKQRAPFRLAMSYQTELGGLTPTSPPEIVVPDVIPEPVHAAPESVSWELYTNTMNVLLDHSRELLGERQALQLQVTELQARLSAVQSEVAILRQTPTTPVRFTPPSDVQDSLSKLAGSAPILSDLEKRLGKFSGLH